MSTPDFFRARLDQMIDLKRYGMSGREFDSVLKALDLIVPVSVHRQGPSVRLSAK